MNRRTPKSSLACGLGLRLYQFCCFNSEGSTLGTHLRVHSSLDNPAQKPAVQPKELPERHAISGLNSLKQASLSGIKACNSSNILPPKIQEPGTGMCQPTPDELA